MFSTTKTNGHMSHGQDIFDMFGRIRINKRAAKKYIVVIEIKALD